MLVTELEIDLPLCRNHGSLVFRKCTCSSFDTLVGEVLSHLTNLRALDLNCLLNPSQSRGRHSYLRHLKTRQLRRIGLGCLCSSLREPTLGQILRASCMRSVQIFEWKCAVFPDLLVANIDNYLPEVAEIICGDIRWLHSFLHRGTIKSIQCHDPWQRLPSMLLESPRSLVHLSTRQISHILAAVIREPSPYRNIQDLGYFQFESAEVSTTSTTRLHD